MKSLTWKRDKIPDVPATSATVEDGWNSILDMIGPSVWVCLLIGVNAFISIMFFGKFFVLGFSKWQLCCRNNIISDKAQISSYKFFITFKMSLSKSSNSLFVFLSSAHFGIPTISLYLFCRKSLYNFSGISAGNLRLCAFVASCTLMKYMNSLINFQKPCVI